MGTWQVFHIICALLSPIWVQCFVSTHNKLQDIPTWMVLQYEGLDRLFLESRKSVALELKFNLVQDVCAGIKSRNFLSSLRDDFQSSIRGQIEDLDMADPIDENGYRRYLISDFEVYLYQCTLADHSKEYFLTHAYEYDNIFFLFSYDYNTKEMKLEALVEEDADTFLDYPNEDTGDIELAYIERRDTYYKYFRDKYPEARDQNELIGDPVCTLIVGQKIRLCALIMNTPYYNKKYIFSPKAENVDEECVEAPLYLLGIDDGSTECMYRCYVNDIHDSERRKAIYVSRAYLDYEVFVFELAQHEGKDVVRLDNNVGNVAFVEEVGYINKVNPKTKMTISDPMIDDQLEKENSPLATNTPLEITRYLNQIMHIYQPIQAEIHKNSVEIRTLE